MSGASLAVRGSDYDSGLFVESLARRRWAARDHGAVEHVVFSDRVLRSEDGVFPLDGACVDPPPMSRQRLPREHSLFFFWLWKNPPQMKRMQQHQGRTSAENLK